MRPSAWQRDAACRESDANFFPERHEPAAPAMAVCRACLVRLECLEYALELGSHGTARDHGVWGGTTPQQRDHARRRGWSAERLLDELQRVRARRVVRSTLLSS